MKKLMSLLVAGTVLLAPLAARTVLAHDDEKGGKEWGEGKGMEMMAKHLGLTDDQKQKIEAIEKDSPMKSLREEGKILMDKLQLLVDSKAKDAELTPVLDSLEKNHAAMADAQKDHIAKMRAILTPTQQAKMALSMGKMMHGMGEWKGGMKGMKGMHGKSKKDKGMDKDEDKGGKDKDKDND